MALTIEINHAKTRAKATAAAGQPVVPQAVKGRVRRIKWAILLLTLSIYYVTPFIRWDRGPHAPDQAVLLDFANGRLYAFFVELWPQDLYLVTGLLVLASTILILTNALAGRLWCGFACPQTVWTDLFLLVERLIEGDRRQRLRNIGAPLTAKRTAQILAKHSAWLLISLATGGTLIFYFTDAPQLLRGFASGNVSANALTWIVVFAGTTYGLAGFARDQVCTFMCPWPRLQGAIWDPEAYTVNYPITAASSGRRPRRRPNCDFKASRRETVSTAASASRSVRSASTFGRGRTSRASIAASASTPATA